MDTDRLKVRMTFWERAEGEKTMHEYMKRHVLTLGFRPDCDLQLESPLQSLMQDKKKIKTTIFPMLVRKSLYS